MKRRFIITTIAALLFIMMSCSNIAQLENDTNDTQQAINTTYETLIYNGTDMIITGDSINEIEPGQTGSIKGINEQEIILNGRFEGDRSRSRAEYHMQTSIRVYITTIKPKDIRCLYISRNNDDSIRTNVIFRY